MMVRHWATPVVRWASASHQPATTNQMTFPTVDAVPASGRRTSTRPNGHRVKLAIRNAAIPNGMVTIRTQQITPTNA